MILAILVAVVSSMSLHHGAMARSSGVEHAMSEVNDHPDVKCEGHCDSDPHSMPVCCGMGLCLSGMPVAPITSLPVTRSMDLVPGSAEARPRWTTRRIDRPPKIFLETA